MKSAELEIAIQECTRKTRYTTEKIARRVAEKCRQLRGAELKAYGCPHCGGYHLARVRRDGAEEG